MDELSYDDLELLLQALTALKYDRKRGIEQGLTQEAWGRAAKITGGAQRDLTEEEMASIRSELVEKGDLKMKEWRVLDKQIILVKATLIRMQERLEAGIASEFLRGPTKPDQPDQTPGLDPTPILV